ncbi:hypothetical protein DH09_11740 [Bacillaceae bacterium JMAK1]|nr:hypothetical protein DH09_11740 [Bacillaceae bacterium JMAK1]
MNNFRITDHPILKIPSSRSVISFTFNGVNYNALDGDTIASALLVNGIRAIREHEESGQPRGLYCNIGHCFECRVTVNEREGQRSCITKVSNGMDVQSSKKLPTPFKKEEAQYG